MTEEVLQLMLKTIGVTSITEAIAELRKLKAQTGELTTEQQTALTAMETYANFTKDIGTAQGAAADKALEFAQDQKIANDILVESVGAMNSAKTAAEELGGEGGGEDSEGTGGFSKLSGGAFKAERAMNALLTGKGVGKAGGLLESVSAGLGMTSGIGFAVVGLYYAFEQLLPVLEKFTGAIDPEKLKESAEHMKSIAESAEKIRNAQTPEESETSKQIGDILRQGHAGEVVGGSIEQIMLAKAKTTQTPEEQELMSHATSEGGVGGAMMMHPQLAFAALRSRTNIDATVKGQAADLLVRFKGGDPAAISQVVQMATEHPERFPAGFAENVLASTPESRRKMDDAWAYAMEQSDAAEAKDKRAKAIWKGGVAGSAMVDTWEAQADREWNRGVGITNSIFNTQDRDDDHAKTKAEHNRKQAETKAHHDALQAQRKAERLARESTPEAVNRRQQQADMNSAIEGVQGYNQNLGLGMTPGQVGSVARDALNRLPFTGGNGAAAIEQAITAAFIKGQQMQQRDIARLQTFSESWLQ